MTDEKPKLEWRNCTCCKFPTECRQIDIPERGCIKARTIWLCAICHHSSVGELERDPLKYFKGMWENGAIRTHLALMRREAAWSTNLLCTTHCIKLWQVLETFQNLVDVEALNAELNEQLAMIRAAREMSEKEDQ